MEPKTLDGAGSDAWGSLAGVLLEATDPDELCRQVCRHLVEDRGWARALIATVDEARGELVGRALHDPSLVRPVARALVSLFAVPLAPREDGKLSASAWCVLRGEEVYLPDARDYSFRPEETFARTFLVRVFGVEEVVLTPVVGPDGPVGMVAADRKGQEAGIAPGDRAALRAVGSLTGHALAAAEPPSGAPPETEDAGGTADAPGRDAPSVVRREMAHDVLNVLPVGLLLVDPEGIVRYLNRPAASFLGVFPWDAMGEGWEEVLRPDRVRALRRRLREGSGRGEGPGETWTLRPLGGPERAARVEVRHLEGDGYGGWAVLLLDDPSGAPAGNEYLSMLVHDLRSPAQSVVGFAELLRMERVGPLEDDQEELVGRIEQCGRDMIRLAEDVLDLEELGSGRGLLRRRPVALPSLVGKVMEQLRPQARDASVELREEMSGPLPPVSGDARRLAQVFRNLLENAIEASRPGEAVRVLAEADGDGAPEREGARAVRVEVVDEGVGLEAKEAERLFEFGSDPPGGGRRGSRGLGLWIARLLTEAHGGTIRAEGAPGRGVTVSLTLPVHRDDAARPDGRRERGPGRRRERGPDGDARAPRPAR